MAASGLKKTVIIPLELLQSLDYALSAYLFIDLSCEAEVRIGSQVTDSLWSYPSNCDRHLVRVELADKGRVDCRGAWRAPS